MSRLTADRLRRAMPEKPCGDPQCDDCDYLRLLEHAARVVEAAEPAVSRRYCRRGHAKADECLAELRLFLYKLDTALEGSDDQNRQAGG